VGALRLTAGAALSCVACGLTVVGAADAPAVDGGASADASTEASTDTNDAATSDGEAPPPLDGATPDAGGPVAIARAGNVAAPTGAAGQTHLVYAENGRRWWLFTITSSASTSLQAWSSSDFTTWTQAMDLPLPRPHAGQGSNFSVAYAAIGSHDVIHLAIGLAGTGS
jgi:hypothetical protein